MILAALLLAAQTAPAAGPVQTAFAEFDQVCGRAVDRDAYLAAAPGAGWTAYEPEAGSIVGRIIALGQEMVVEWDDATGHPDRPRYENAAFRKTVNGRELVLLVSFIGAPPEQPSTECRVFDFAADAPTDAEISAWTQAQPSSRTREQGVTAFEWQPAFREGFSRIAVIHVDPSAPARAQIPALGLGIMSIQGPPSA